MLAVVAAAAPYGWVTVLVILVAVAARELGLVFRAAGLGGRLVGLGDRVAKYRFD